MPSTRLTVALNANRNTKTVLLLLPTASPADLTAPTSIRSQVLKSAQTKLRLKVKKTTPPRFFAARTGAELLTTADWARACTADDAVILVSAGEDFVGTRKDGQGAHPEANPDATVASLAHAAYVDPAALAQLRATAAALPGIAHAAGQPDLHPGTKFPIGAVFVSDGWVHPPLIGGDIGCGMAWYRTALSRRQVDGEKGRKVAEQLRGLEGPWREQWEREGWLGEGNSAGEEWDRSLGTIGAGNHFAEIQVVERADEGLGLSEGEVVLLVHSGSRGYGGDVLKRFTADGHASLKVGEEVTQRYLEEHDRACRWAKANRDLIALRFLNVLEPGGKWSIGSNDARIECEKEGQQQAIKGLRKEVQSRKVVDIWHNNVQRVQWPPKAPADASSLPETTTATSALSLSSHGSQQCAYIHRKGAAPTLDPDTFKPLNILPLPGSRATPTAILTPSFSQANAHGATNALSLAHGAGRAMSRAKALQSLCNKYKGDADSLLRPGKTAASAAAAAAAATTEVDDGVGKGAQKGMGTWVVCEEKQLVWEEAPEAYKDVWAVAGDLIKAGAAEIRGWCAPRISYKVRNE
ncbi:tRNA-splicing ligase RtcB-domain-containing protein [Macrophomina phaseolina]|uniref:3'-phosphate/5'-hydroxy nucleic acid ligase n=1 Tax=Macrophomina phaseolina TaxID=35725 RepID=A0ABQ8FWX4_9PEZI|nr:tRNA-splicing ligase RtcB-domain-containing protein [Macrophomina phaseolina]